MCNFIIVPRRYSFSNFLQCLLLERHFNFLLECLLFLSSICLCLVLPLFPLRPVSLSLARCLFSAPPSIVFILRRGVKKYKSCTRRDFVHAERVESSSKWKKKFNFVRGGLRGFGGATVPVVVKLERKAKAWVCPRGRAYVGRQHKWAFRVEMFFPLLSWQFFYLFIFLSFILETICLLNY